MIAPRRGPSGVRPPPQRLVSIERISPRGATETIASWPSRPHAIPGRWGVLCPGCRCWVPSGSSRCSPDAGCHPRRAPRSTRDVERGSRASFSPPGALPHRDEARSGLRLGAAGSEGCCRSPRRVRRSAVRLPGGGSARSVHEDLAPSWRDGRSNGPGRRGNPVEHSYGPWSQHALLGLKAGAVMFVTAEFGRDARRGPTPFSTQ